MPGFNETITQFVNGQPLEQGVLNAPLTELQANILYLRDLLNSITGGQALQLRSVALATGTAIGKPVYYDSTNSRYDLAQDDGTAKADVVGICTAKQNSTLGDICILGHVTLDIGPAVGGSVDPGWYYLSTSVLGGLTSTRPARGVPVCIADSQGAVFVLPQVKDYPSQPVKLTGSGNTTNSFAEVFSATNADGLVGVISVKNTGGSNGLSISLALTDLYGTSGTATANVAANSSWVFTLDATSGSMVPPYSVATLSVKSQVADSATSYVARGSVVR